MASEGTVYDLKRRIRLLEGRGAQRVKLRADMDASGHRIRGLAAPKTANEPATKEFAESAFSPIGATYVLVSAHPSLTSAVVLTGGAGIAVTDNGKGSLIVDASDALAMAWMY